MVQITSLSISIPGDYDTAEMLTEQIMEIINKNRLSENTILYMLEEMLLQNNVKQADIEYYTDDCNYKQFKNIVQSQKWEGQL